MHCSIIVTLLCSGLALAQATDVVSYVNSRDDLSALRDAILLVPGLADSLSGATNITIFAPTNQAFEDLPDDIPEGIAVVDQNVTSVGALLLNHIVLGQLPSEQIGEVPIWVQSNLSSSIENDVQPFLNTSGGQWLGLLDNQGTVNVLSGEYEISNVTTAVGSGREEYECHV